MQKKLFVDISSAELRERERERFQLFRQVFSFNATTGLSITSCKGGVEVVFFVLQKLFWTVHQYQLNFSKRSRDDMVFFRVAGRKVFEVILISYPCCSISSSSSSISSSRAGAAAAAAIWLRILHNYRVYRTQINERFTKVTTAKRIGWFVSVSTV